MKSKSLVVGLNPLNDVDVDNLEERAVTGSDGLRPMKRLDALKPKAPPYSTHIFSHDLCVGFSPQIILLPKEAI